MSSDESPQTTATSESNDDYLLDTFHYLCTRRSTVERRIFNPLLDKPQFRFLDMAVRQYEAADDLDQVADDIRNEAQRLVQAADEAHKEAAMIIAQMQEFALRFGRLHDAIEILEGELRRSHITNNRPSATPSSPMGHSIQDPIDLTGDADEIQYRLCDLCGTFGRAHSIGNCRFENIGIRMDERRADD